MKTAKTFRFSEEAIKILNEQDNATEFLESLILDMYQRPLEVVPLSQLKEMLEALGPSADISRGQPAGTPPENKNHEKIIGSPTAKIDELKNLPGITTANELEYGDF